MDRRQILSIEGDLAAAGLEQARNGVQRSALARAVGANQGHDFILVHLEGNPLDGVDGAVEHMDILNLQKTHAQPSFCLPR